jgi:hypothetical protein
LLEVHGAGGTSIIKRLTPLPRVQSIRMVRVLHTIMNETPIEIIPPPQMDFKCYLQAIN